MRTRFFKDGRYHSWHKEPSLKLISRKKQFKKVKRYVSVFKDYIGSNLHESIEAAMDYKDAIGYQEIDVMI